MRPRRLLPKMISFSFTEVQRLRIHGEFGHVDDARRPCGAPSDRRCVAGIFSYPSVFEREKATVCDYIEKHFQGLGDNSAGMAIHPRSAIHRVLSTNDTRFLFLISFCAFFSTPKGATRLSRFLHSPRAQDGRRPGNGTHIFHR